MSCRCTLITAVVLLLAAIGLVCLLNRSLHPDPMLTYKPSQQQWGKSDSKSTDIKPFEVNVSDEILDDLKKRLDSWRPPTPTMDDVDYSYGLPTQALEKIVKYWREGYDWRKAERKLNSLPQFQTVISGLNVHFIHAKGDPAAKVRIPLLIVHGWPGSVVEFYKVIPLLTANKDGVAFDVVAPSIPGYAFSEAAAKPGFSPVAVAEVFAQLMTRLGYEKYVYQGGDWGALIGIVYSHIFADKLIGFHTNIAIPPQATLTDALFTVAAWTIPSLVGVSSEETRSFSWDKMKWWLQESGYFHEQATKPDTLGVGLSDSPVGLAAWILEKFATWSEHVEFKSGKGLTNEEMLTDVMVYWVTNHVTSSTRLYKEMVNSGFQAWTGRGFTVPTAVACYPAELSCTPKALLRHMPRLVQYSSMPAGGHFAAFEQPEMFADDLRSAAVSFLRNRAEHDNWHSEL